MDVLIRLRDISGKYSLFLAYSLWSLLVCFKEQMIFLNLSSIFLNYRHLNVPAFLTTISLRPKRTHTFYKRSVYKHIYLSIYIFISIYIQGWDSLKFKYNLSIYSGWKIRKYIQDYLNGAAFQEFKKFW